MKQKKRDSILSFFTLFNELSFYIPAKQAYQITAKEIPFVSPNCVDRKDTLASVIGIFNLYRRNRALGKDCSQIEKKMKAIAKKVRVKLDSEILDYLEDPDRLFQDGEDMTYLHDTILKVDD